MRPEVLALIPARGGSKSVPRKNLLPVAGKPLLAYSIEHALGCPSITRVIVSTDDAEISEVAMAHGASIPFIRPAEYASDAATDLDVFRHALGWLQTHEHYEPELVVHLRPTGPVREIEHIEAAIDRMRTHPEADALRSVSLCEQTPYKMWQTDGDYLKPALPLPGYPEAHSMPRQELPPVYWQNGYVDVIRPRTILEKNSMCGERLLAFIVNHPIVELDYPEQIPRLEQAVLAWLSNDRKRPEPASWLRHPA